MPSSMLFALDNEGRVFGISTNNTKWREFPYLGLEFKHLSAVPYFLWAVGGDRQIYVHVHGLDIPIRIKEEAYENQRWLPMDGFSKRLLPTDRHNFSSKDGLTERRLETIRLPSMAWQWEGDWHLETTLDGQPLDHDGWTYAVDFPVTYHAEKQWSSCVRRRKWVRYRRYTAMNSWCAIAPLHKDPTQEPFIDVCIGGQSVAGAVAGSLQVWAVTAHGRVMWRGGVSHTAPEGTRWSSIPVPTGCEVRHISCGPTGLVWAALWNGRALVRVGVSGSLLTGDYWLEVVAPEPDLKLSQVSVGGASVWALTSDGRVWFRKGVRDCASEDNEGSARGSGWVEMVGRMVSVSVAPNDQVWAVGSEDRGLYCRCGVSNAELTGRRWRAMRAPSQSSRASSSCSSLRSGCGVQSNEQKQRHHSTASLNNKSSSSERGDSEWSQEASRSAPTSLRLQSSASQWQRTTDGSSLAHSATSSTGSVHQTIAENSMLSQSEVDLSKRSVAAWSPVHSVGSLLGLEVNTEMDPDTVLDPESERDVFRERERPGEPAWQQAASLWTCVEAGALFIDPLQLPNWFVETSVLSQFESASWRTCILLELKRRHTMEISVFEKYELAVELASWVKSGECRCCLSGTLQPYEDCLLELECVRNQAGSMDSGALSVLSVDKGYTQCQLPLGALTLVQNCSEPGSPRIAVHTVSTTQSGVSPLRLLFSSDTDMHDWMAHLTSVCCQMNGLEGAPGAGSIWATTALGEVYTYDPVSIELHQQREGELFTQALDVRGKLTPMQLLLANGFPSGSRLFISGLVPDNAERFVVNLQCQSRADCKEIALHLNPRFPDNCFVRNTMTGGDWGKEEREGALTLAPGEDFTMDIICQEDGYKISINGMVFTYYEHRLKPDGMIYLWISGSVEVEKAVYYSKRAILSQNEMFWRQMGGHLSKVETCRAGVTWGLGADNTPWVYTGGWGGTFLNGLERSSAGIFPLSDTHCCYVYENQRWNPLNGFTTRKLPTDRPMWSDATGRVKQTKETTRLLSMHWQWVTDWVVDYNTPGGVDKDGWQYAVDFSTSYHRRKHLTDYVRRRRWLRKCRYTATGPWQEAGNTKLCDVSLAGVTGQDTVWVWAVGANGDALFRRGVSKTSPVGDIWEHIPCDQALCSISCGSNNQVWAAGSNGSTYWRFGITANNPMGEVWECVEPPGGAAVTQVCVGRSAVWVLDRDGRLHVRRDVTPVFPEGTHWQLICDPAEGGVRQLSVGGDEVWAVTWAGAVCCRSGVTADSPEGDSWHYGLAGNWQHISARGFNDAIKK